MAAEHHGQCRARILSASPTISNGAVEIDPMVEQNALVRATTPAHPMGRGPGKQRIQAYFTILVMRIRTLSRGMLSSPIPNPATVCAKSAIWLRPSYRSHHAYHRITSKAHRYDNHS